MKIIEIIKTERKMFIFSIITILAVVIWIYINNQYSGMNNIPHNSITMWNFILNYLTFFVICFFIVAYFVKESTEEYTVPHSPPPPKIKKIQENKNKEKTKEKTTKSKKTEKAKKIEKTNKKSTEKDVEKVEWANLYKEARKG